MVQYLIMFNPDTPICSQEINQQKTVEQMVSQIEATEPQIEWQTYIPDKQYGVVIKLPFNCSITGTLNLDEKKQASIYLDVFEVNEKLRGRGIGSKLIKLLIDEGKKYEAQSLSGHFTSVSALKALSKVVGESNPRFTDRYTGKEISTPNLKDSNVKVDAMVKVNLV